jgi:hypothetical protein
VADLQAGLVTREQALALGVSDPVIPRLLREGSWLSVATGVYRTASVTPDWSALAWAGVLLGGDHARLGGPAAGLTDVAAGARSPPSSWATCVTFERAHDCPRVGGRRRGRFRDMNRDNRFVLGGLSTLRHAWFDVVDHPCLVAAQVGQVLLARGCLGPPGRCGRCEADLWQSA